MFYHNVRIFSTFFIINLLSVVLEIKQFVSIVNYSNFGYSKLRLVKCFRYKLVTENNTIRIHSMLTRFRLYFRLILRRKGSLIALFVK